MDTISVEGLPEPIVRAIEAMVQALRAQIGHGEPTQPVELPLWHGTTRGVLTREDIYDDVA